MCLRGSERIICTNVQNCTHAEQEDIRDPGAGDAGNCELPDLGDGNQI